jgi:DNA primase
LRTVGSNYKGLCPLHNEKTPSFTVSIVHENYKCFGCGEGGDAIDLVQKIEKCDFTEAVRIISEKFNIDFVEVESDEYKKTKVYSEAIETIYKGNKPTQLQIKLLHEIHLCNQYGFILKGRKLFAIKDEKGLYRGLSGRKSKDDINPKSPKYVNSPQSEIFNKSELLYNLYEAKQEIRKLKSCILCEGFTDVDTLKSKGVFNVVANCGTAFTQGQAKLIKRYCDKLVILFDGDSAGLKATYKALDIALKEGLQVQAIFLKDNQDPKDYIENGGNLKDLKPLDLLLHKSNLTANIEDIDNRNNKIKSIVTSLSNIKSDIYLDMYVVKICKILNIRQETIYNELALIPSKIEQKELKPEPVKVEKQVDNTIKRRHKAILENGYIKKLDTHIIAIDKMTQPNELYKSLKLHIDMVNRHEFLK